MSTLEASRVIHTNSWFHLLYITFLLRDIIDYCVGKKERYYLTTYLHSDAAMLHARMVVHVCIIGGEKSYLIWLLVSLVLQYDTRRLDGTMQLAWLQI